MISEILTAKRDELLSTKDRNTNSDVFSPWSFDAATAVLMPEITKLNEDYAAIGTRCNEYYEEMTKLMKENSELKGILTRPPVTKAGKHAEEMEQKLKTAIDALKFYASCLHFKKETVRGKMIEIDPDAGPLYDRYEEVLPTEERGRTAQEALVKIGVSQT